MRAFLRPAITALAALTAVSAANAQSANPTCQRLEAQLASLDRGNADPQRADRIRRAEDAVNRQQYEVDRLVSQSRQNGCESSGFFSIFSNPPPQCGGINRQIGQQRSTLERLQVELEQLSGGNTERMAQRQSLMIALGDNNCGPQYRSAAIQGQQGGFFDRLFGGNTNSGIFSTPQGQMGGTYRTICVRTCDGYYFPISYATSPDRFNDDAQVCQRSCPAAQVQLYVYHNPGEEVNQAVSLDGQPYTALPTAFAYRKALDKSCGCRRPGESWAEAMKVMGGDQTLAPGDVVVTEESAKRLSLPRDAAGRPIRPQSPAQNPAQGQQPQSSAQPSNDVRSVGPAFVPQRQQ
ncbi:DUF2865 domain-containing protein [Pseudolabrys sp. FHR47]|uniref:DUF2865 domain-containing protein n=1 Tax=Pseudolabrys sp. FHR47 TaxID=2562284 RepID=UPI0010BE28A7|nr:DUF2865 domain-containing protein [Pseudolabrys sp. FHR47]